MFSVSKKSQWTPKIIQQSAWWVVYYVDLDNEPRYLLIKRQAVSKKIERVCPKGKVQEWETHEDAALREVSEETGLILNQLHIVTKLGVDTINAEVLYANRYIKKTESFKVLAYGTLTMKLNVSANSFSESARAAIEALGGTVTIIE